jgi:hypothetical protein
VICEGAVVLGETIALVETTADVDLMNGIFSTATVVDMVVEEELGLLVLTAASEAAAVLTSGLVTSAVVADDTVNPRTVVVAATARVPVGFGTAVSVVVEEIGLLFVVGDMHVPHVTGHWIRIC